jgi:tetratricopeptide (TPR) repeat protein
MSAIGIILALFVYITYKETKKLEETGAKAQQACNNAEQWEEKARTAFKKTETRAESTLEQIDRQVKVKLEQIEKRGEESIKKIDDKSEIERRISELWNTALRLYNKGKYEEACDKYAEIVKLEPDRHEAYNNWGNALGDWARIKGDEKLFEQSCQKFEMAIKFKPNTHEAYYNWGIALADWAEIKGSEELFKDACDKYAKAIEIKPNYYKAYCNWGNALTSWARIKNNEELLKEACSKYAKAIEIKPDFHEAYNNWANVFIEWSKLKIETPEHDRLLKQAEEKALKAESLKKGEGAYNLACVWALRGNKGECRKWLLAGQEAGTLVTRDHAMKDKDLDSLKNEQWFKEIKWKGEK